MQTVESGRHGISAAKPASKDHFHSWNVTVYCCCAFVNAVATGVSK